ncbi:MAG: DUF2141 domain-containing protein [Phaeodactylibacter sp.]|nr:DUF2141 domain-containing protein [Phaeodactylibacter sp.]MCB9051099.1 DUF2141 domain-containing protein [Lewinellaceae bacterium]
MAPIIWMSLMLSPATGVVDKSLLIVNIHNLETGKGEVHIALYDSEVKFMVTEQRVAGLAIPVKSKEKLQVPLGAFPPGDYAIAVFHDLNGNGELDKNALGIPVEPYAFSNNPRAKWRAPTFRETQFKLREPKQVIDIEMKRWKEY